nr:hypothetical protein [Nocardia carnea]
MPLVGVAKGVENLAVATGHGMWGMILAPVTAELITEYVIGPGAIYDNFLPRPLPLGIDVAFVGEADSYDATVTITVKR